MLNTIASTTKIEDLLAVADVEDIHVLVDYITDNGKGRLSLADDVCKRLMLCKENNIYPAGDRELIAKEIRLFGGNSVFNLLRKDGVPYEEIVQDVANHQKINFEKTDNIETIEREVLTKILARAFEEMSDEERRAILDDLGVYDLNLTGQAATAAIIAAARMGGFTTFKMTVIVANAIAKALLGRGIPVVTMAPFLQSIKVLIGPVGWIVTALWTAFDLASPAYRVTLPCIVQLAYIRQKAILASTTKICDDCSKLGPISAKFCSNCGAAV